MANTPSLTTPRLLIPYPGPTTTPWFATFQQMVLAIDASLYTPREDRNIIISGGGTMTFNSGSGILTWSAQINLLSSVTGYQWQIPAGTVTLQDGQLFYITVTRAPQANTQYVPVVGAFTPNQPNGDNQILIGIRLGTIVHFRDGFVIGTGQSKLVFDNTTTSGLPPGVVAGDILYFDGANWVVLAPGTSGQFLETLGSGLAPAWATPSGGGAGLALAEIVFTADVGATSLSTFTVVGGRSINMANFPATLSSLTRHMTFFATLEQTPGVTQVNVQLFNVNDAVIITGTNLSAASSTPVDVSVSVPVGTTPGTIRSDAVDQYEVQIQMSGGSPVTDRAICTNARIVVTYS